MKGHPLKGEQRTPTTEEVRTLANRVREKALIAIEKEMDKGKGALYQALLLRLSTASMPRMSEITGGGGEPIKIEGVEVKIQGDK